MQRPGAPPEARHSGRLSTAQSKARACCSGECHLRLCHAGSMYCFRVADAYLKGFLPIRAAVVTGNHDLEGEEFETDAANLAAWTKVSTFEEPCIPTRLASVMQAMQHQG